MRLALALEHALPDAVLLNAFFRVPCTGAVHLCLRSSVAWRTNTSIRSLWRQRRRARGGRRRRATKSSSGGGATGGNVKERRDIWQRDRGMHATGAFVGACMLLADCERDKRNLLAISLLAFLPVGFARTRCWQRHGLALGGSADQVDARCPLCVALAKLFKLGGLEAFAYNTAGGSYNRSAFL